MKRKRALIAVFLLLCMGVFVFLWRVGAFGGFIHGEIKEITVKTAPTEEICFQNLLLSASMLNYGIDPMDAYILGDQNITKEVCIFNTGDVYYFEWRSSYPRYYDYIEDIHRERSEKGSVWEKMENMVYLGRLSEEEIEQLCQYVFNYDSDGEYYCNEEAWEEGMEVPETMSCVKPTWDASSSMPYHWMRYIVVMYQHRQLGTDVSGRTIIEHCQMDYITENGYEKSVIYEKSYEENALAALEVFENSEIYEKWLAMCNLYYDGVTGR